MAENATRRAWVRGALLGLACGDGSVPAGDVAAWAAAAGRLRVTDDTVLALVLAEHLVGCGARVDQDALGAGAGACLAG